MLHYGCVTNKCSPRCFDRGDPSFTNDEVKCFHNEVFYQVTFIGLTSLSDMAALFFADIVRIMINISNKIFHHSQLQCTL